MSLYEQVVNTPVGRLVARNTPLPQPAVLERWEPGGPVVDGTVLVGTAAGGRARAAIERILREAGVTVASEPRPGMKLKGLVFDATGIDRSERLAELYAFVHEHIRSIAPSGRLLVVGTPSGAAAASPREATAQRALEGFVRSAAKELRHGATAQLVLVRPGAEDNLTSTVRFVLSARSAYVNAQVIEVGEGDATEPADWDRPLAGRTALITGASRGIGAAIAEVFARDGAQVVGLDVPAARDDLEAVTGALGGRAIALDVTEPSAPAELARQLAGGVDVVVHNAGITRDVTLARMPEERWASVLDVNLSSQERINDALLDGGVLRPGGRIVCVSSISGIAGNAGQANYATSKAGVIGMVRSMAPVLAERGGTINAVAPGFIETQMTAKVPFVLREAGRRMNSLSQGGLPVDVAEAIAWFASPASGGVNGNVVRVCGQSLLGA